MFLVPTVRQVTFLEFVLPILPANSKASAMQSNIHLLALHLAPYLGFKVSPHPFLLLTDLLITIGVIQIIIKVQPIFLLYPTYLDLTSDLVQSET